MASLCMRRILSSCSINTSAVYFSHILPFSRPLVCTNAASNRLTSLSCRQYARNVSPNRGMPLQHPSLVRQNSLLTYYGKHTAFSKNGDSADTGNKSKVTKQRVGKVKSSISKEGSDNLSLWQKFKVMYKDYWYILVPVHLVTSTMWAGLFYGIVRSGFDITPYLDKFNLHIPENAGYFAIAYAMYKLATPARYFITVTGTTVSIHYLRSLGLIRPVPSRAEITKRYRARREKLKVRFDETKDKFQKIKDKQQD